MLSSGNIIRDNLSLKNDLKPKKKSKIQKFKIKIV